MSDALIIFVKNPQAGKVKTRLAADIGDQAALKVYSNLISFTRDTSQKLSNHSLYVFYSKHIELNDEWSNARFDKMVQEGNDLGQRMDNAFKTLFEKHSKLVLIGSDCPELQVDILHDAFNSLNDNDICIGPSHDGGYYLIGMKKPCPELFKDIQWSTSSVYQNSIDILNKSGYSYKELIRLHDLDNIKDLERFPDFKP